MILIWLPNAEMRLDEIYNFYKERSLKVADDLISDIIEAVEPLKDFPQMAAIEPILSDLSVPFRSLVVRNHYKIVYYIDDLKETVFVATVWDCRQHERTLKSDIK